MHYSIGRVKQNVCDREASGQPDLIDSSWQRHDTNV